MEFPENVWDLFGESAVKAMDKYMDDSLYAQIRSMKLKRNNLMA